MGNPTRRTTKAVNRRERAVSAFRTAHDELVAAEDALVQEAVGVGDTIRALMAQEDEITAEVERTRQLRERIADFLA